MIEGFSKNVTGGAGGQVIKVTNLNSDGPGSLKAAIETAGARIVVFDVSGVIEGDIRVPHGDITIAGQTAPGDEGITLNGHLYARWSSTFGNIVLQHIRLRPPAPDGEWRAHEHDGVLFSGNQGIVFDHVDVSHGADENIDFWNGARNVTVQWSIVSYPRYNAGHNDGAKHNYGLINGPGGGNIAVHHNLFAHAAKRNPALADGPADVRNNLVYNYAEGITHHNAANGEFNFIGNVFKDGQNTQVTPLWLDPENPGDNTRTYHSADNLVIGEGSFTGVFDNPFENASFSSRYSFHYDGVDSGDFTNTEISFDHVDDYTGVTTHDSADVEDLVLECAGAFPRDATSLQAISDTINGTGAWGNDEPILSTDTTLRDASDDADNDGMLDAWEDANGLDSSTYDANATGPDGGVAIVEYLQYRSAEVMGFNPNCLN